MAGEDVVRQITSELTVDVVVAGRALGVGRNVAYREARAGRIPTIKVGNKLRVPTSALREMLKLPATSALNEAA